MLGYPKYFEKTVINKSKKLLREGNNSALIGPHEIILDEHEIVNRTPGSEIKTRWESFVKLTETAEHMFLYTTNFSAIVIPKEKAVADTVKEQIFEFIRNKIKK
jgi:hypothetical protein